MNSQFLSFSSGCVINFDDIGEFPDYHEVITQLLTQIEAGQLAPKDINTFVEAELDDVQHIPQCSLLFLKLTQNFRLLQAKQTASDKSGLTLDQKFVVMLLKVIKNYFISFSLDEEEVKPLIAFVSAHYSILPAEYLVDFTLSISEMAAYAERHDQLLPFMLSLLNESQIFANQQLTMMYLKAVDKLMRFRLFREQLMSQKQGSKNEVLAQAVERLDFLRFKVDQYSLKHARNLLLESFHTFCSKIDKHGFADNESLQAYLQIWKLKLNS